MGYLDIAREAPVKKSFLEIANEAPVKKQSLMDIATSAPPKQPSPIAPTELPTPSPFARAKEIGRKAITAGAPFYDPETGKIMPRQLGIISPTIPPELVETLLAGFQVPRQAEHTTGLEAVTRLTGKKSFESVPLTPEIKRKASQIYWGGLESKEQIQQRLQQYEALMPEEKAVYDKGAELGTKRVRRIETAKVIALIATFGYAGFAKIGQLRQYRRITRMVEKPFKELGIKSTATMEQAKRAYRDLALRFHPDRVPPARKVAAGARFKKITEAYTEVTHILSPEFKSEVVKQRAFLLEGPTFRKRVPVEPRPIAPRIAPPTKAIVPAVPTIPKPTVPAVIGKVPFKEPLLKIPTAAPEEYVGITVKRIQPKFDELKSKVFKQPLSYRGITETELRKIQEGKTPGDWFSDDLTAALGYARQRAKRLNETPYVLVSKKAKDVSKQIGKVEDVLGITDVEGNLLWKPTLPAIPKELEPLYIDKFGKKIVKEKDGFRIAVNNLERPTYISIWDENKKIGFIKTADKAVTGAEDYVLIDNVEIQPKYRKQGLATELYRTLLRYLPKDKKGLMGYGPDIVAKKDIAGIYKQLGGFLDKETGHYFIPKQALKEPFKPAVPEPREAVRLLPAKPKEKITRLYVGIDPGIDKFVAEEIKPLGRKIRDVSIFLGKSAKYIPQTLINIFEPSKFVELKLGKEPYATVIRGIHKPEAKAIEFSDRQLDSVDSNINELSKWFKKYSDKDLDNFMLSRGRPATPEAMAIQREARNALPRELKAPVIQKSIQEIADFNYKFLQKVAGDDINKVADYFYGVYKNPKQVSRFLDYWKTTDKFIKQKKLPTVADAKVYGLELKDKNPVENLKREFLAISRLEAMNWMKGELMRTGEGIYIAPKETAPTEWEKIDEPIFNDVRVEPTLAKLINNLISTNKITQTPGLNALRLVNNALRSFKFIGSAFHLGVIAKQSVADSGYLGFAYKKTALRGATTGFRENDPIFRDPFYRDYLEHGGGHKFSLASDAQTMLSNAFDKINRGNQLGGALRIGGVAAKLPMEFVRWMFNNYIPKVKYAKYLDTIAETEKRLGRKLTKSPADSAIKIDIIKEGQNFYGMMNERLFGRSGTVTTALRFFFMAPGFAEGNYRTMAKAGIQWGRKGTFGAGRSRFNIVNSLIITAILSTVGTLIFTQKSPEKPKTLDDIRDLFKIDTGKVDTRGRKIMIDLLTYDKDYFNVYFNLARGRPDKAVSESIKRIGGMKATTLGMITDLSLIMQGRALYDYKGDKVVEITDPFLKKMLKISRFEIEKIQPISVSVFKQSRRKGIDTFLSGLEAIAGVRPTITEADKRKQKILQKMYSLYGQRDDLYRYLGTLDNPSERVDYYNRVVRSVLDNKIVPAELREEWDPKLIIDKDRLLSGKVYRLRKVRITDEEARKIEKYIRNWGIKKEDEQSYIRMYRKLRGKRKREAIRISRRRHP